MVRAGSKNNKINRLNRVGVLAGGASSEREISLRSGKAVYRALKRAGYNTSLLIVSDQLEKDIKKFKIDVAFIALHGKFGEDGTAQKILENLGVPYTGSGPMASKLALDKIASRREFEKNNIPVPRYRIFEKGLKKSLDLDFPLVVKPQFEGSSIGLSLVERKKDFLPALDKAYKYGDKVIVEEFIRGREITVGILDDQALPALEIVPKGSHYDFFAKYKSPDTKYLVPAPLAYSQSRNIQELALRAHRVLGCASFSRVDMMLGDSDKLFVLEVNSIPGLTSRSLLPKSSAAIGIPYQKLCIKILEAAFLSKKRKDQKGGM